MTATLSTTRTHTTALQHPVCHDRQPNYAIRRAVAGLVAVVAFAVVAVAASAVVGALLDVDGRPAAASDLGAAPVPRLHVAQPGDTLWSIAEQYRGDVDRARFVDALIDLNDGTAIQAGQAVRLP